MLAILQIIATNTINTRPKAYDDMFKDGIRDHRESRGLGDVYKRQILQTGIICKIRNEPNWNNFCSSNHMVTFGPLMITVIAVAVVAVAVAVAVVIAVVIAVVTVTITITVGFLFSR